MYEEDVHVPLMFWFPRLYRQPTRTSAVGSHIDLAPTIAELAGVPPAPDWQGRSLFDRTRAPRAYFYVAEDHFTLGLREDNWKYIFTLREGPKSCTTSIGIRTSSTTWRRRNPSGARACGSGWRRGPRRTAGSTSAPAPFSE